MRSHAASSWIFRELRSFSDVNWNVSFILLCHLCCKEWKVLLKFIKHLQNRVESWNLKQTLFIKERGSVNCMYAHLNVWQLVHYSLNAILFRFCLKFNVFYILKFYILYYRNKTETKKYIFLYLFILSISCAFLSILIYIK